MVLPIIADKLPLASRFNAYCDIIETAFAARHLKPEWGFAFARQESAFKANATNRRDAGDLRRGGSFGLFQMSMMTARALGFKGSEKELLKPETNSQYAAELIEQLHKRYQGNLKDIAACYNSGKSFEKAPLVTQHNYVPNVLAYALEYGPKPTV